MQEARAYNNSIYLMVGVPYAVLGTLCFMIYRGCKKNELFKNMKKAGEAKDGSSPASIAGDDSSK